MNFDANNEKVSFGYAAGYYGSEILTDLHIDPVENRLLIEIIPVPGDPDTLPTRGHFDGNHTYSDLVVTDDSNEDIVPLLIESTTLGVYADVLIEP